MGSSNTRDKTGWLQANLKTYFALKCIRIPVRSTKVWESASFDKLEFRFGNKSNTLVK